MTIKIIMRPITRVLYAEVFYETTKKIDWRHSQFNYGTITGEKKERRFVVSSGGAPADFSFTVRHETTDSNYLRDSRLHALGGAREKKLNTLRVIEKRKYAA